MKTGLKHQIELIRELNELKPLGLAHQTKALRTWLVDKGYDRQALPTILPESVHDTLHRAMMADHKAGRREMSSKELSEVIQGGPDDNPALERLRARLAGE